MLHVRLTKDLETRLENLAANTGRTKTWYVQKALSTYLEDQEDYELAVAIAAQNNKKYTLAEIKEEFDLA